jgi:hypothetical protein
MSDLERKASIIDDLDYPKSNMVEIDTDWDIDSVEREIKTAIWDRI